jgi:hypothetical protein
MIRPFSLRRFGRLVRLALLALVLGPAGLRLAIWITGHDSLSPDLLGPPQIVEWHVDAPRFGGISALVMATDGRSLIAGGDRGILVEAPVLRDNSGQITGMGTAQITPVRMLRDRPLTRFRSDFEALTRDPEGGLFTAFEGYTRIERLARPGALPTPTHRWDRFTPLFGNQGFEALATLPDGRVIAIRETPGTPGPAPSVIYDGTDWRAGPGIPVSDGFAITGADVGPDGCLYLVERRFTLASGFSFRLMRVSGGSGMWDSTLLYAPAPAGMGNAEAVSAWTASDGTLMLSVLTDNNFLPFTPTRLIELPVRPGEACVLTP